MQIISQSKLIKKSKLNKDILKGVYLYSLKVIDSKLNVSEWGIAKETKVFLKITIIIELKDAISHMWKDFNL